MLTRQLRKKDAIQSEEGKNVFTMLIRLVEIQKIAYSLEKDRSQRPILRCFNLCFEFANLAIELFVDPKKP